MKIAVEAFAVARDRLGFSRTELELPDGATVRHLFDLLRKNSPAAADVLAAARPAVNDTYAKWETLLRDGDLVSVIPPVSGGSPAAVVSLDRIDVETTVRRVESECAGAVVLFVGTVRNENEGCLVKGIEYEAKEGMATTILDRIAVEARERFGLTGSFIQHRFGPVPVGEASVVIAVSSPHRDASYEANRWILERLKKEAPIWKKEQRVTPQGTEEVWLGQGGG